MIYDFAYRPTTASMLGAFVPLRIEGAPDHGTVADARVWADHYDVRIELTDRTGRLRYVVAPGQPVRPTRPVWLDSISSRYRDRVVNADPLDVSRAGAAATFFERARTAVKAATERVEEWHDRMPIHDEFIVMRGAEGAMSGKTAWLGAIGSHPLMQNYAARAMRAEADEARAVRDASLLGFDEAVERAQAKVDGETFAERIRRRVDEMNAASRFGITVEQAHRLRDAWLRAWSEQRDWFASADVIMRGPDGPVLIDFKRARRAPDPPTDPTLCRRGLSGVTLGALTALTGGAP